MYVTKMLFLVFYNIPVIQYSIITVYMYVNRLLMCRHREHNTRANDHTHKLFESLHKEVILVNSGGKTMYSLSKLAVILVVIVLHLWARCMCRICSSISWNVSISWKKRISLKTHVSAMHTYKQWRNVEVTLAVRRNNIEFTPISRSCNGWGKRDIDKRNLLKWRTLSISKGEW